MICIHKGLNKEHWSECEIQLKSHHICISPPSHFKFDELSRFAEMISWIKFFLYFFSVNFVELWVLRYFIWEIFNAFRCIVRLLMLLHQQLMPRGKHGLRGFWGPKNTVAKGHCWTWWMKSASDHFISGELFLHLSKSMYMSFLGCDKQNESSRNSRLSQKVTKHWNQMPM